MYCKKCGSVIDDNANICPYCGTPQTPVAAANSNDNGGILWGLLGCCIPIVGLVLFLVWKDTKPRTAKAAGIGALVSVIIGILYDVVGFAAGVGFYAFS